MINKIKQIQIRILLAAIIATGMMGVARGQSPEDQIVYLYPRPQSVEIRPQTSILLRLKPGAMRNLTKADLSFHVTGEQSGRHTADLNISHNTIVYKPYLAFNASEEVDVLINCRIFKGGAFRFSFTTSEFVNLEAVDTESGHLYTDRNASEPIRKQSQTSEEPVVLNGVAVPSDFPILQPYINSGTAPGRLFLTINSTQRPYFMILENDGTPYFYRRPNTATNDFKMQRPGVLSRLVDGNISEIRRWETLDSNYMTLREYKCQDGFRTDGHDIQLTPEGTALLIAMDYRLVDMSQIVEGGNQNATVLATLIQEIDEDDNVVFLWNSWDYLNIDAAEHENLQAEFIDYVHMNSVAVDFDGNVVFSNRHLSECTKINRTTGEIIWRLGGKYNQFEFVNDSLRISYQHDIRPVPGKPNYYTIFDNGNFRTPEISRAVEFRLDTLNMTAERVWEFRASPDRHSRFMGSVQRLPNGNSLINWAVSEEPKPTEVANGSTVYEADLSIPSTVYRVFRHEWEGQLLRPYLVVDSLESAIRLIFNKFGDDDVDKYNIYGGITSQSPTLIASTSNTWLDIGFDQLMNETDYDFKVTGVNSAGEESDFSNTETVFVNLPTAVRDSPKLPDRFSLSNNSPNPFDPVTRIVFATPKAASVSISIYDVLGRRIRVLVDGETINGRQTVEWDGFDSFGRPATSGVYFYRLTSGRHQITKKMLLLRR